MADLSNYSTGFRYPHMCRDGHREVGHADSENEQCPVCLARDEGMARLSEATALLRRLEGVGNDDGDHRCPVCSAHDPGQYGEVKSIKCGHAPDCALNKFLEADQ